MATELLQQALRMGLVSRQERNGWPQNVWMVYKIGNNELPLEAMLENPEKGTYHGYPMPRQDPFRDQVLARWKSI